MVRYVSGINHSTLAPYDLFPHGRDITNTYIQCKQVLEDIIYLYSASRYWRI